MILRPLLACLFLLVVLRLVRAVRPSRYALLLGCLLLYLPVMGKLPLNLAPGVNGVTLFLVALLLHKENVGATPRGAHEAAFRGLLYAWLAVCAWGLLLGLSGDRPVVELTVLFKRWLDPIFACLLALRITRQEDRRFVVICVLLSYFIVGAHGLRHGLDYGDKVRIGGLLDQANDLGAFLAMYAPLGLSAALFLAAGQSRYVLLGGVWMGGWALLFTQSRAALLGLPLGVLSVLFRSGRAGYGCVGLLLVVAVWAFPDLLPEQATARFESTYVEQDLPGAEEQLEESAESRMNIWRGGLAMIADNPWGVGFGQFQRRIEGYATFKNKARDAHNFYLLVAAELGLGGLVVLLALVAKIATVAWAASRQLQDALARAVGLGFFACVLVTIVVNVFGSRMMTLQVSTYFWVLAALVVRAHDCQLAEETAQTRLVIQGRLRTRVLGSPASLLGRRAA